MDGLDSAASGLAFRWLGAAGLAFQAGGRTLLIDPFFTRPPVRALLALERVRPDPALVARHAPPADYVLVTHAHYDHLLDVPEVLRLTGARAYGSANTCDLLALHGLPAARLTAIRPGDRLALGPFAVEVFPARHTHTPLDRWINGPLPDHLKRERSRLPLRLIDYRMDDCFSFRIQAGGQTLLVGNHPVPAGLLFLSPYHPDGRLGALLAAARPRLVAPIHWDDFTRPLSRPLRPMLVSRRQGLAGWPPVRRLDLAAFARQVKAILPEAHVLAPELFKEYRAEDL
jgi:L-ascorbate metabolism protein UlaG (beta-lactamase superfamily)